MTSGGSKTPKKGEGRYPPNPLEWTNERNALGVREKLHLDPLEPLSPPSAFAKLLPKIVLRPHGDIPCAQKYIDIFRGPSGATWSALTLPGDHGDILVIYNEEAVSGGKTPSSLQRRGERGDADRLEQQFERVILVRSHSTSLLEKRGHDIRSHGPNASPSYS